MGSSTNGGEMWPIQASVRDIRAAAAFLGSSDGAGAPLLSTDNSASISQRCIQPSPGLALVAKPHTTEELPTLFITIKYFGPSGSGRRAIRIPWFGGLTVQRAVKIARRTDSILRIVNVFSGYARVIGKRRVRLHDTLRAGDTLEFNPVARPFI